MSTGDGLSGEAPNANHPTLALPLPLPLPLPLTLPLAPTLITGVPLVEQCLSGSMYEQIPFTAINGTRTCDEACLTFNLTGTAVEMLSHDLCPSGQYNSAATLLLQPVEEVA